MSRQIKQLKDYFTTDHTLFKEANQLPQFFQTNLVDDARVVKQFKQDPQANLRVFYYQYLKLCFQIDNVDYEGYIQKIYELIRTEDFQFYFEPLDPEKQFNNRQYKSLLIDFFELMNTGTYTVDYVLTHYPIINEVFTNFFRTVVMLASITKQYNSYIDKTELFDFLSSFFSVDISSYDRCLKFVESDIFVYEQNPENIFMAYIRDDQQIQQIEENKPSATSLNQNHNEDTILNQNAQYNKIIQIQTNQEINIPYQNQIAQENKTITEVNTKSTRARTIIKQSYIEGQFTDYTNFSALQSFGKPVHHSLERSEQKQIQYIIDKITTHQSNSEVGSQQTQQCNFSKPFDVISHQNNKQLKRVLSNDGNLEVGNILNDDQREKSSSHTNKQGLIKQISQPNLFQNKQKRIQSDYQKVDSITSYPPTKDPGFSINSNNLFYQHNQYLLKENQQIFHKPNNSSPIFLGINNYSNSIIQEKDKNSSFNPSTTIQRNKRLKLDVTKQFSNSFVMKCMKQPFKSNVHEIRERARQYRKSIYQDINYTSNIMSAKPPSYNQSKYESSEVEKVKINSINTTNTNPVQIKQFSNNHNVQKIPKQVNNSQGIQPYLSQGIQPHLSPIRQQNSNSSPPIYDGVKLPSQYLSQPYNKSNYYMVSPNSGVPYRK